MSDQTAADIPQVAKEQICTWAVDDAGDFVTDCGRNYGIGKIAYDFIYCPTCGKHINIEEFDPDAE